jgi:hypothetical protein
MRRNEVEKLAQQLEFAGGLACVVFVFHALPCWQNSNTQASLFYTSTSMSRQ